MGKPQYASTSQASASVIFANIPLTKEMAKSSFKGWRNGLYLLGKVVKSCGKGAYILIVVAKGDHPDFWILARMQTLGKSLAPILTIRKNPGNLQNHNFP